MSRHRPYEHPLRVNIASMGTTPEQQFCRVPPTSLTTFRKKTGRAQLLHCQGPSIAELSSNLGSFSSFQQTETIFPKNHKRNTYHSVGFVPFHFSLNSLRNTALKREKEKLINSGSIREEQDLSDVSVAISYPRNSRIPTSTMRLSLAVQTPESSE